MAARSRSRKPPRAASRRTGTGRKPAAARARTRPRAASARASRSARPAAGAPAKAPNGRGVGNGIGLNFHHMDYTTHDLEAMKRFYSETLGFTNVQLDPSTHYLMVNVTPSSGIGFMPAMGGAPDQWRPPGEPSFYFFVDDVDETHRKLSARGVSFEQEPRDMPWGHRVAILKDPEGRGVCLAQRLGK